MSGFNLMLHLTNPQERNYTLTTLKNEVLQDPYSNHLAGTKDELAQHFYHLDTKVIGINTSIPPLSVVRLLGKETDKYQILLENTYNMDEKGFLIRRIIKALRVCQRHLKTSRKLPGAG